MNIRYLYASVALVLLGLGFEATTAVTGIAAAEPQTLTLGAAAPDFDLPGIDGRDYSLSDFDSAKVLVVIFTCNHCPTAQAYEQRIIDLHRDYAKRDVALVAISPNDPLAVRLDELGYSDLNDSFEEMKLRAKQRDFKFPYLYDGDTQKTSREYGALATPHVFIFDAARRLRYVGRIDDNDVKQPTSHDARNAIEELLAGKQVRVPQTRVFGCSTKWSDKRPQAAESLAKWNAETAELAAISPTDLHQQLTKPSDKYRLVNVWATWCIPCVEEMDDLVTIHRMYRGREFELITISADDPASKDKAQKVLKNKHCSARNFMVEIKNQDELFDAVDPEWQGAVPYTMLISPAGEVVHRVHGEFDSLELKRVIVDHLGRTYAPRN
ncbi:MAG: redoxin domain-containing protein [Pirellulaceae bacterium]|jgi:peroxiredoxin|nr:redoxin domain-containing protein [Pirellulaceae bacterium]